MGRLIVLNQTGDEPMDWDPENAVETEKAQKRFEELKAQGYEFFEHKDGEKGAHVGDWTPALGRIIAVPGVKTEADKQSGERPQAMGGGPGSELVA